MEFENPIWKQYHELSKESFRGDRALNDNTLTPQASVSTIGKEYARLPIIKLESSPTDSIEINVNRVSENAHLDFNNSPIDIKKLSKILQYSLGVDTVSIRPHLTLSHLFPVEAYVLNFVATDQLPSGVYHYDIKAHALRVLYTKKFDYDCFTNMFKDVWAKRASCAIVMTGAFTRAVEMHGERGYRYVLLEAGHIAQNIYLTTINLEMHCCITGDTHDTYIEELLDIHTASESLVHTVLIGA